MHLLFQELLFIEGGSAVEPVFVIIGTMWSHFYVLQRNMSHQIANARYLMLAVFAVRIESILLD